MRRYLRETGRKAEDTTAIICHMGGGVTISLHRGGKVIDTSHGLGGDGPITPERAGCCPPYPLIDMCFSGQYTKQEIKKKLIGKGGAVAYFGTNDMREVVRKAKEGEPEYVLFMKAFVLNIANYKDSKNYYSSSKESIRIRIRTARTSACLAVVLLVRREKVIWGFPSVSRM